MRRAAGVQTDRAARLETYILQQRQMACENYHAGENTAAGTGVISAQPRVTQSPVVTGVGLQIPPRTVVLAPPGPVMMSSCMPQMLGPSAPSAGTPIYVIQ